MITVFGSINIDLACRVEHLPVAGETILGGAYMLSPGGKGANQALAAARAGARVRLVGAVGRDAFAEPALELLVAGAVDVRPVKRCVTARTGLAMIAVDARGENQIVVSPGANAESDPDDIPEDGLGRDAVLLAQMELPPEAVVRSIERARQAETRIVLNLAPAVILPEAILDAVDVLILNELEARVLAHAFAMHCEGARELARQIGERRQQPVIVTAGAEGAFLASGRGEPRHVPAPPTEVIDTTGAGDACVGALTAAFARGMPLIEAVRRGVAAGALTCRRQGAQAALPLADEIEALAEAL